MNIWSTNSERELIEKSSKSGFKLREIPVSGKSRSFFPFFLFFRKRSRLYDIMNRN